MTYLFLKNFRSPAENQASINLEPITNPTTNFESFNSMQQIQNSKIFAKTTKNTAFSGRISKTSRIERTMN